MTAAAVLACACGQAPARPPVGPSGAGTAPDPGGRIRDFHLTARPATIHLSQGLAVHAWTYNGQVPGPLLRVRVGDLLRVHLRNDLPQGTTIHWHGIPVPYGQDGVAGVSQDPVPPGGTATYAFVPRTAGTYWYHSHERGAGQVDRGLYGALVVDPRGGPDLAADDHTLIYDEWPWGLEATDPAPPAGTASMLAYVTDSVNGRTGSGVAPLAFTPGRNLRLRLVNAGYVTHYVHLEGAPVAIAAMDGHELTGGSPTSAALPLGAGERLDLELTAPPHPLWLRLVDASPLAADVTVPLAPAGSSAGPAPAERFPGILDLLAYTAQAVDRAWPAGASPTRRYTLTITAGTGAGMPGMTAMPGMGFLVNGRAFPATPPLIVSEGDLVEVTFVNQSGMEHAMHLHGHVFQVLARDGRPLPGTLVKDTVVVRPGRSITIGFVADNPGWWMIHCHQLRHAEGGLMLLIRYTGVPRLAQLGGPYQAIPD